MMDREGEGSERAWDLGAQVLELQMLTKQKAYCLVSRT